MVFELRQYHIHLGQQKAWVKCMEEEIIPFQVKMGMVILGSFVGEEDESVYVWIRRFENEQERKRLYDAVYQSDYWKSEIAPRVPAMIDRLVNNAGYRIRARFEELPRPEWDAMVQTNLTGVFLLSQAVGRVMIRQGGGKIVNVTSVAGRTGSRGMAAYAAAKAGVTALTQSLGAEWAKYGITVNAVAPGPVETEGVLAVWKTPAMIAQAARDVPLQRLGRPEEIAWAVIFVASDEANFMTGETVYVSGGPRVANRED